MTRYLSAYVITAIVFSGLDFAYLSTLGVPMFRQALGDQLATPMRAAPAIVFYLLFIAGLVFFAVAPAFDSGKWTTACLRGAALGLIAYATYDLTNYATLARWTSKLVLFDLAWGTIVSAVSASIGYALANRLTS